MKAPITEQKSGPSFLERMENFRLKQEKNLEDIKNKYVDPDEEELTFKPKLSQKGKQIKRSVDDLLVKFQILTYIELETKKGRNN